ncbi:LuxR family transcriptional regulator [Tsukamurella pulmonis]|uniref:DNA-binding response regulator, NarL/FixJ family, contains REC and HTH domains n=1 Tax=Tsukamurella pulmonis TaxID=47312 RepID=A0A1H1APD1_9ACTN|nr:response regulator transcription factor [Tsukamurella pulmonis]KXO96055.1 LuxR family transcriptional regulator [Tsukamurella pulmonis]KXP08257.1 LuxR family transcriptional regulator [Tsukamurella pulmonis]RDH12166.1 DNA-binding response regulator [Tsukamurella pulmonis]SDQ41026.1 DNA-binding response regulator, NarL/FixJ family, contains REC and HTH domains [Tsukamurella pulmonis]SUP26378.1 Response regulator protein vraR [Tsukamurella pulmonis]
MIEPVRVLIADDEALVRAGLRALIQASPGVETVGEAATGDEALRVAAQTDPDVVLMDVRMPVMNGTEATAHLAARGLRAKVLMVTTFDDDEVVFAALRAGASGFVLKDTTPERLIDAIRTVAAGESLLSPSVTRRLISEFVTRRPEVSLAHDRLDGLTQRECDVLRAIAAGLNNDEIASALFISITTVKTHISRLLSKLGVRSRTQLAIAAYETGLVVPGSG